MKDDPLARLEEKLAWLQRHVTEQDKAMFEMSLEIDRLKKQMTELRTKSGAEPELPGAEPPPPHY